MNVPLPKLSNEADILSIVADDPWMMKALRAVRSLKVPDAWIGAGFVRNKVWDVLHGYLERTPLNDLDVIFFSRDEALDEQELEKRLTDLCPEYLWEVTNQGIVHLKNEQAPYLNSVDALSRWTESATCLAVTLEDDNSLRLAAPHGISDLLNLVVRPTPHAEAKRDVFQRRIQTKDWFKRWPRLRLSDS